MAHTDNADLTDEELQALLETATAAYKAYADAVAGLPRIVNPEWGWWEAGVVHDYWSATVRDHSADDGDTDDEEYPEPVIIDCGEYGPLTADQQRRLDDARVKVVDSARAYWNAIIGRAVGNGWLDHPHTMPNGWGVSRSDLTGQIIIYRLKSEPKPRHYTDYSPGVFRSVRGFYDISSPEPMNVGAYEMIQEARCGIYNDLITLASLPPALAEVRWREIEKARFEERYGKTDGIVPLVSVAFNPWAGDEADAHQERQEGDENGQ